MRLAPVIGILLLAGCLGNASPPLAPGEQQLEAGCLQTFHQSGDLVLSTGPHRINTNEPSPGYTGGGPTLTLDWSAARENLEWLNVTATWNDTGRSLDRLRFEVWSIGSNPYPSAEGPQPLIADTRVAEGTFTEDQLVLMLTTANNRTYPLYADVPLEDQPVHFEVVETYRC